MGGLFAYLGGIMILRRIFRRFSLSVTDTGGVMIFEKQGLGGYRGGG